tara:strand:+ start:302 stop:487 length:186 start_codon:yes stop_codon:yes gene_type:complete
MSTTFKVDLFLTKTYCSICEKLRSWGKAWIKSSERIGRARAAAQLTSMGMHKEARQVMLDD